MRCSTVCVMRAVGGNAFRVPSARQARVALAAARLMRQASTAPSDEAYDSLVPDLKLAFDDSSGRTLIVWAGAFSQPGLSADAG